MNVSSNSTTWFAFDSNANNRSKVDLIFIALHIVVAAS